ncbi:MAG: hypothetical protein PVG14_00675 [Anaerolineales bacterium]
MTAVCSKSDLTWVENLGTHVFIDRTREDFIQNGEKNDLGLYLIKTSPP